MSQRWFGQAALSVLLVLCVVAVAGCSRAKVDLSGPGRIAVTTSWLGCALRDVTGGAFDVIRMSPPGSCPGHFDMKPSQLAAIRGCDLLMRFDFQKGLDAGLARMREEDLRIVSVAAGDGLCVPETYLDSCRQVARAVSERYPNLKDTCDAELRRTEARLGSLAGEVHRRMKEADLVGKKVLSSAHQAVFARWLGLDVVGTFKGSDSETVRALAGVIERGDRAGVKFVIANLQEGDKQAKALSRRLDARVVVFSNFPDMSEREQTFDDLVRANLDRLLEAAAQ